MSSRSSRRERALPDSVTVARVRRPHGLRGEVLVETLSDVAGRFVPGGRLQLVTPAGERRQVRVLARHASGAGLRLKLEGCEDREAAETLRGCELEVSREQTPPAPPGSYYYFELLGCSCRDQRRGELGRVAEVVEDGGGLLLRVEREGAEILVPFVAGYIREIDVAGGRIELDLPEGLIEACGSTS